MLFPDNPVLVRGGGDLATGVVWRLTRAGFPVVVSELGAPLAIRRRVAVSTAVTDGRISIDGMHAVLCQELETAVDLAHTGKVAVIISPTLPDIAPGAVVDARMAKHNIDTSPNDGELVIGLGPGFVPGKDCNAVVETKRGPHLGRVLWDGPAEPDTGTPGVIAGKSASRVVRAPVGGTTTWQVEIGDRVLGGAMLGSVDGHDVRSPLDGVVRGLIQPGQVVPQAMKIADIDPRDDPTLAKRISDKALSVGGGAVEAVLTWLGR